MALYLIIAFFLIAFSILGCFRYKTEGHLNIRLCHSNRSFLSFERLVFVLFLMLFAFLTAMRAREIGNDTQTYVYCFEQVCKHGLNAGLYFENGYNLFVYGISRLTNNPHIFLIITSMFCYGMLGLYTLRYSSNLYISACLIFCFCFSPFTNVIRQDIAMVICLFAYQLVKSNRIVFFVVLVIVAAQFHTTAYCLFFLLLKNFLPTKNSLILIISFFLILLSCAGNMSDLLVGVFSKYDAYFDSNRVGSGWLGTAFSVLRAYFMVYIVQTAMNGIKKNRSANAVFLGVLFFSALGFQMNLINRCALYFLMLSVVELPNALSVVQGNRSFYNILFFCVSMIIYFLAVLMIRPEWNCLIPYRMW